MSLAPSIDVAHIIERLNDGYEELNTAARRAHHCARPIRLSPVDPKEARYPSYEGRPSAHDFDEVHFKACGTRRASLCRACSDLYKGDARVLIRQGLDDGLGLASAFVTFTAPSFGTVHRAIKNGAPCHEAPGLCAHGRPLGCAIRHRQDDERIGAPICEDCYDYEGSVLFNALAGKLWQRSTIALRRQLARTLGLTVKDFNTCLRLSYVKVVEFQRRGVIHLHVIIRLDHQASTAPVTVLPSQLVTAIKTMAHQVEVTYETPFVTHRIRWGDQLDIRLIDEGAKARVGNYLAKYATKSSTDAPGLDHRLKGPEALVNAKCAPHLKRLALVALQLGRMPEYRQLRLDRWAHDLGHRGHFLTKSRAYSVTFAYLRGLRRSWQESHGDKDPHFVHDETLYWVGNGWPHLIDRAIVISTYEELQEVRRLAWDDLMYREEVNRHDPQGEPT